MVSSSRPIQGTPWRQPVPVRDRNTAVIFRSLEAYLGRFGGESGVPSTALSVDAVGESLGYRRVITDATASTWAVTTTTPQFTSADVGRVISANKTTFAHALQPGTRITAVDSDGMGVTLSKRVFATGALGLCTVQSPVVGGFVIASDDSPWGIVQDVRMAWDTGMGRVPGDVGYWVNLDVTLDSFTAYTAEAISPTGLPIPGGPGAVGLNVAGQITANAVSPGGGMFVGSQIIPRIYNGAGLDGPLFTTYLGYVNQGMFFATGGDADDDLVVEFKPEADNEHPWVWSYSASNIFSSATNTTDGRVWQSLDAINVRHIGYAAQNNTLHGARLGQNIGTWVQGGHSRAQEHFYQPSGHRLYLDGTTDPAEVDPAVWNGGPLDELVIQLSSRSVTCTATNGGTTLTSSAGFTRADVGAVVWDSSSSFDGATYITEYVDSSTVYISSPTNLAVNGAVTVYETLSSVGFAESGHIEIKVASYKDGPLDTLVRFNYTSLGLPDISTYGLYGLATTAWPRFKNVSLDTDFGSWAGDTTSIRGYWTAGAYLMQPHYYGTVTSTWRTVADGGAAYAAAKGKTVNGEAGTWFDILVDSTENAPESGQLTCQASYTIYGLTYQSSVVIEYASKDATHFRDCFVTAGYGNLAGGQITTHGLVDDNIGHQIDPLDRGVINSAFVYGTSSYDYLTRIDETGKIWSRNGIEVGSDRLDSLVAVYGDVTATDHVQGKYVTATGHGADGVLGAVRLVGSKDTAGAPTTGIWQKGDVVVDLSTAGTMWVCRIGNYPYGLTAATWDEVGPNAGAVSATLGALTVTGNSHLGNNISSDTLTVEAISTFEGSVNVKRNFSVAGTKFIVDYLTGDTTIDGTADVSGLLSALAGVTVTGAMTADTASIGGTSTSGVTATAHGTIKSILASSSTVYAFQAENYGGVARMLLSSANGNEGSPTATSAGDVIGQIAARGRVNGSTWAGVQAKIAFTSEDAPTASLLGGSILMSAGKVGTTTVGDALYVGYRSGQSASEVRAERLSLGQTVATAPSTTDALVNVGTSLFTGKTVFSERVVDTPTVVTISSTTTQLPVTCRYIQANMTANRSMSTAQALFTGTPVDGQMIVLEQTSNFTWTITGDGTTGLRLSSAGAWAGTRGSTLTLRYNGTRGLWVEQGRSVNSTTA